MGDEFVQLGQKSLIGVFVEVVLLGLVVINSTLLTVLLLQTKDKLSTATILFIFNILFSNALFLASFVCMFSDFYDDLPYGNGTINEDQLVQSSAALIIAETLQTHLFAPSQFFKHLVQETLFSLAQNGSSLDCTTPPTSDYREIGQKCDRVAVFHEFGVYLLRGHTLFTLIFLLISILVFVVTLLYHLRVRTQHDFLGDNLKDHSPYRRRETLFNTLLLSIGAFFISVLGQSFVEIAVFWVDDRYGVAHLATYYQLARILAFMDPLLNPLLVAVRTPTMRRKLRYYICIATNFLSAIFCPWKILIERRKRRTASSSQRKRSAGLHRRPSSTTATVDSSKPDSSDSEVTLKLFCTSTKFRSSLLRRSKSSAAASNSIV
uniref:G-protein coupled receptors family 1 profile domain-containing protein n=1 Tax=Panagrolaimus sp. JU765 TaxID=591449 RepID=A0AC34QYR9_9BILA